MNVHAIRAIYTFEMSRTFRTIFQSIATPVITTSLYFVVFGSAIGSRMVSIDGVSYGAFIVPGLIMLTVLTESLNNASFGIYMPKFAGHHLRNAVGAGFVRGSAGGLRGRRGDQVGDAGHHHPRHRAPVRAVRDRSIPFAMFGFLILTSVTFSLLGFAIGIWADSWEKTSIVPTMIVTPLTFLGGSFYSLSMLPPVWQKITLFNPVVYLINGFRWSFYGKSDVNVVLSVSMTFAFMLICLGDHRVDVQDRVQAQELTVRSPNNLRAVPHHKAGPPFALNMSRRMDKVIPGNPSRYLQARRPASSSPAPITMAPMPAHTGTFTVSLSFTDNSMGPTFASCVSLVYENLPYASPSTPAMIKTIAMILVELMSIPV